MTAWLGHVNKRIGPSCQSLTSRLPLLPSHSVIVHELLERGANVHAVDPGGYKALHHAVVNGYYGATNELLTR